MMPKSEKIDKKKQENREQEKQDLKNGKYNSMQERVSLIEKILGIE